jgi:hypothetical protein
MFKFLKQPRAKTVRFKSEATIRCNCARKKSELVHQSLDIFNELFDLFTVMAK